MPEYDVTDPRARKPRPPSDMSFSALSAAAGRRAGPRSAFLLAVLLLGACGGEGAPDAGPADEAAAASATPSAADRGPLPEGAEAWSLLGEALYPPEISDAAREVYEANLETARAAWEHTPEVADSIIWYGRRLAYLGLYREAIGVFTEGIRLHPDDARLYRHRGHRYVSVREFDAAIADFRTAIDLIRDTEDEVEPDGLPNALGIPTSTLHFNIWYHLGLAHYLKGEFEQALLAWNSCLEASRHPDSVVATTYWLNNTLRRLGLDDRADELLAAIDDEVAGGIIESTSYLDVLRLHRGERTPEELLGAGQDELANTTTAYGVGMWHFVNGRREEAYGLFEQIVTVPGWSAFGYVAAEAELARQR